MDQAQSKTSMRSLVASTAAEVFTLKMILLNVWTAHQATFVSEKLQVPLLFQLLIRVALFVQLATIVPLVVMSPASVLLELIPRRRVRLQTRNVCLAKLTFTTTFLDKEAAKSADLLPMRMVAPLRVNVLVQTEILLSLLVRVCAQLVSHLRMVPQTWIVMKTANNWLKIPVLLTSR